MPWIRAQEGYIKFKVRCPACGRMVKGHLKLDEYKAYIRCDCGRTELSALFYRSLEWLVEAEAKEAS